MPEDFGWVEPMSGADYGKAMEPVNRELTAAIRRNMDAARRNPRMRTFYAHTARLQNRMIVNNNRAVAEKLYPEYQRPEPVRLTPPAALMLAGRKPDATTGPRTHLDAAREAFAETGLTPIPAICTNGHEWIDGGPNGAIRAPSLQGCRCFHCGAKLKPHPTIRQEPPALTPLAVALGGPQTSQDAPNPETRPVAPSEDLDHASATQHPLF